MLRDEYVLWTQHLIKLVLSQEIVSTPLAEFDRDSIKHKWLKTTNILIELR